MTVVVTGSSGFIGSHLVGALEARGERVTGIDRRPGPSRRTSIIADLADPSPEALDALCCADAVWHLAARPSVRDHGSGTSHRRHRDNVVATERVAAAVPDRTLVVVTSSSSVYGGSLHGGRERPCREDDLLRPHGAYATSKLMSERVCERRAARGGRVAIARPFTVAGEHQRPDMAIATWIRRLREGQPIALFGSPSRTRDISDVTDVVRGLIAMAERDVSGAFNLGSGKSHSLGSIVRRVAGALGCEARIEIVPAGPEEVPATLADTTRCETALGVSFATDLGALVRRQVAAAKPPVLEETG